LAAELFPVHGIKSVILPTDFNSMGYAVPAAIGAKLANPELPVNVIVGDGAFAMSCMEILTAVRNELGIAYYVFHDGELSQIAQARPVAGPEPMHDILARQREAFLQAGPPTLAQRRADLRKLRQAIKQNAERIALEISGDFGNRSRYETLLADVWPTLAAIRH